MLSVSHLRKDFGDRTLFRDVSFTLPPGRRIGLVGPNGSGKSTLLRILAGRDEPDAGSVSLPADIRVAWLPQHLDPPADSTVADLLAPSEWQAVSDLEQRMAAEPTSASLLERYAAAREAFERAGGYAWEARAAAALADFGLALPLDRRFHTLSGGERTRVLLARVVAADADVLLLDEPTNHLDLAAIQMLEDRLLASRAACLTVSHDRRLLDRIPSETLASGPLRSTVRRFADGYTSWRRAVDLEEARAWREYRDQQERARRLADDIRAVRNSARGIENATVNDFARGRAKRVASKAKARETRLERMLSDACRKEKPRVAERMRLVLEGADSHRHVLLQAPVLDWLRARSAAWDEAAARTFLHRFLFTREEVFKPVAVLSRGERARVLLAGVMLAKPDLMVLDEPGNHLDLPTLERLEEALADYPGALLAATHDRELMERMRPTWVWDVSDSGVRPTALIPDHG